MLELTVKPGPSNTYPRLMLIFVLFSIIMLSQSSLLIGIQLVITYFLLRFVFIAHRIKKPYHKLDALKYFQKHWVLEYSNEEDEAYNEVSILIHNILFQVLRFSSPNKKKLIILFNDQVEEQELRLLHLAST